MKKAFLAILIILIFTNVAFGRSTRFTKERKAQVQQRRDRIMQNGNIDNIYPRQFNVEWFVANNKAYMGIFFNRSR